MNTDYFYHSGTDGIRLQVSAKLEGERLTDETTNPPIPEEYMDKLEELIGNGRATVTFGLEVKTGEFSNQAGASCFIKLTCDQSEDMIERTRVLAQELAEHTVSLGHQRAERILAGALGKDVPEDAPRGPIKNVTPTKALKDPEERSQTSNTKPSKIQVGKNKPSFRR